MQAAVLRKAGQPLQIEDVQVDQPGPREVLIRTVAAGVCHSDLHIQAGTYPQPVPAVLGHESAGIIEAVGPHVQYVKPGDRVVTCLSVFCGLCEFCLSGNPARCRKVPTRRGPDEPSRLNQNGEPMHQFADLSSFAEQMLVHENAVVKIQDEMPLEKAALLGCGVTTGVGSVFNTAQVEPGSTVAVIGCGGVGLSAIQGAVIAGAGRIVAVDRIASKLELAKSLGATDLVDASQGDVVKQVKGLIRGGVDYSFEAIGLKETAEQAFRMLKGGGTATVIGMIPVGTMVEIHGAELLLEKKLQGSNMGSNRFRIDLPKYADFYLAGRLKLDEMVSREITLDEVNEAFDTLRKGEVARQVIRFDR
jgi:S-(hydroxymethyl)glutathione dehydrogenase/alcohol dehydrogenase